MSSTDQVKTGLSLEQQVELALERHRDLPPAPFDSSITPETFYLATPNRLAYALAWIAANQIVQRRFPKSGIDALPVFHPENGWDRFLLTRRVTGKAFAYQPANEFGMLKLDGDEAPRLTTKGGGKTRVALGEAMLDDPEAAIKALLAKIPRPKMNTTKADSLLQYEKAKKYPAIYQVVTELILENPGLVASREIYIDDEMIDGQYHPLYLHSVELSQMGPADRTGANMATITYNWFQLQIDDRFAYFDRRGNRSVYRTDRQTWSRVTKQLVDESPEQIKARIEGWLRLNGRTPNPEVD